MNNLINKKFGRLLAIKDIGRKHGSILWLCKCDCGNEIEVISYNLTKGLSQSCGCLRHELASERMKKLFTKHGHNKRGKRSLTYASWNSMKTRCFNKNHMGYQYY